MARRRATQMKSATGRGEMMTLVGDQALASAFLHMRDSSVNRIMRPAINKGLTIAKREAKSLVPRRSGALRKAIASKSKTNKRKGAVYGMLFVRRDRAIEYEGKTHDPAKIAHLVEFGTRHTKPRPFLRRALGNKRPHIQAVITNTAREKMNKEAAKARAKGKRL